MDAEKKYHEAQAQANFQPGDKVRCIRKAEDGEAGWCNNWVEGMDAAVGQIGTVVRVPSTNTGIRVSFDGIVKSSLYSDYYYPHFILEKVEASTSPDSEKS